MGLWHVFKNAQLAIWKCCSQWLFGPLFHTLWPNSAVLQVPKHKFLTWLLSLLRLGYADIKDNLDQILNDAAIATEGRHNLLNLRTVLEYFIPVVILY